MSRRRVERKKEKEGKEERKKVYKCGNPILGPQCIEDDVKGTLSHSECVSTCPGVLPQALGSLVGSFLSAGDVARSRLPLSRGGAGAMTNTVDNKRLLQQLSLRLQSLRSSDPRSKEFAALDVERSLRAFQPEFRSAAAVQELISGSFLAKNEKVLLPFVNLLLKTHWPVPWVYLYEALLELRVEADRPAEKTVIADFMLDPINFELWTRALRGLLTQSPLLVQLITIVHYVENMLQNLHIRPEELRLTLRPEPPQLLEDVRLVTALGNAMADVWPNEPDWTGEMQTWRESLQHEVAPSVWEETWEQTFEVLKQSQKVMSNRMNSSAELWLLPLIHAFFPWYLQSTFAASINVFRGTDIERKRLETVLSDVLKNPLDAEDLLELDRVYKRGRRPPENEDLALIVQNTLIRNLVTTPGMVTFLLEPPAVNYADLRSRRHLLILNIRKLYLDFYGKELRILELPSTLVKIKFQIPDNGQWGEVIPLLLYKLPPPFRDSFVETLRLYRFR